MTDGARAVAVALLAGLVLVACGPGGPEPAAVADLRPIAHPDLSGVSESARLQLDQARRDLDEALSGPAEASRVVEPMGRMAMLYHAYGLHAPAAVAYENVIALDPGHFDWRYAAALSAPGGGRIWTRPFISWKGLWLCAEWLARIVPWHLLPSATSSCSRVCSSLPASGSKSPWAPRTWKRPRHRLWGGWRCRLVRLRAPCATSSGPSSSSPMPARCGIAWPWPIALWGTTTLRSGF